MSQDATALEPNLEAWARKNLKVLGDLGVSTRQLASALAGEIESLSRRDSAGVPHPPDQFNLSLNVDDAAQLAQSWGSLRSALISGLRSTLEATGYHVGRRLHLSFSTDPTLDRGGIQIIAWHSGDPLIAEGLPDRGVAVGHGGALPDAFLVVAGKRIFKLDSETVAVGRRLDNDLVIDNPRVSRRHAIIQADQGQFVIKDLQSTAGTLVNGRRIRAVVLKPGDVIRLAETELVYGESPGEPPTKGAPYEEPPAGPYGEPPETPLETIQFEPPVTEESPDYGREKGSTD
jgi:hypothetical protein